MQNSLPALALAVAMLTGCSTVAKPFANTFNTSGTSSSIIGTWQWVRIDQQEIKEPFFMRFYPDGRAVSWPAPTDWGTTGA